MIADGDPDGRLIYNKMNFGEFVEIICRFTIFRFCESEMSHLNLFDKLKYALKSLFALIKEECNIQEEKLESPFDRGDEGQSETDVGIDDEEDL